MTASDIRSKVRAAIAKEWPAFEEAHPNLAAVIDEDLIVDSAVETLSDDPAYQETIADAVAAGNVATVMSEYVARFVKRWIKQLL